MRRRRLRAPLGHSRTHLAQPRDETPNWNPSPQPAQADSSQHSTRLCSGAAGSLKALTGFGDCRRSGRAGHHPAPPDTLRHGPAREGNCEQGQRR